MSDFDAFLDEGLERARINALDRAVAEERKRLAGPGETSVTRCRKIGETILGDIRVGYRRLIGAGVDPSNRLFLGRRQSPQYEWFWRLASFEEHRWETYYPETYAFNERVGGGGVKNRKVSGICVLLSRSGDVYTSGKILTDPTPIQIAKETFIDSTPEVVTNPSLLIPSAMCPNSTRYGLLVSLDAYEQTETQAISLYRQNILNLLAGASASAR